jgi:tryptophan synthase beta chain
LPFIEDDGVELVGVEAGGHGVDSGEHASRFEGGHIGVAQGYKTYFLQNPEGQMLHTHSIAAGLDYVGVGPLLSHLHDEGRVRFMSATDQEVVDTVRLLIRTEGLIPALESTHGLAGVVKEAATMEEDEVVLFNLSGRGDKDIFNIAEALDDAKWREFIHQKSEEYRNAQN